MTIISYGKNLLLPLILLGLAGCGRPSASTPAFSGADATPIPKQDVRPIEHRIPEIIPSPAPAPTPEPWFIQVTPPEANLILMQGANLLLQTNGIPLEGLQPNLASGEYDLHLYAEGYSPYRERLIIRPNQQPLYYSLRRLNGDLRIKCQPGTDILIESTNEDFHHEGVVSVYGLFETHLPEGAYRVTLSQADYYPTSREVTVRQAEPAHLEAVLEGRPASVVIHSPVTQKIREGVEVLGQTGAVITNLPPGDHAFTLQSDGFRPVPLAAHLPPNGFIALTATAPVPSSGALSLLLRSDLPNDTFFANAPKTVTLSGETLRQTNTHFLVESLPCGELEIVVEAPGYRSTDDAFRVMIQDGQTQSLQRIMHPQPVTLILITTPRDADIYQNGTPLGHAGDPIILPPFQPLELTLRHAECHPATLSLPAFAPGLTTQIQARLERAIMIEDLYVVPDAESAETDALAPGSRGAMLRQQRLAQTTRMPLEVVTRAGHIPLRLIPSGVFRMGSPFSEPGRNPDESQPLSEEVEDPQPEVEITESFYLGKYEITQRQWEEIMGENPSSLPNAGPDAPVENISWEEAQSFVARLCILGGVPPDTYRLPTEAEWEYACRAGTTEPTYAGAPALLGVHHAPLLDRIAWYGGNCGVDYPGGMISASWPEKQFPHQTAGTHLVGKKLPNAWGLYDTLGNAWEWCADYYATTYETGPLSDPTGPERGVSRVCRGSGWHTRAARFRAAERYSNSPKYRDNNLGLRILRIGVSP